MTTASSVGWPIVNKIDNEKKKIVVGVGGGIAAYKSAFVVRGFKEAGADVTVVPTESSLNFVGRATWEALSGNPVSTTVFDAVDEVRHVRVGQEADLVVIAPATADLIARLAMGRADDLLTATVLVATSPVLIVPAMHTEMWFNPATQDNVATLRKRGIVVMEPAHGRLTGKDTGPGRLPEPEQILSLGQALLAGHTISHNWVGRKVLITAGGTQENIDPVRYIGNRSSGRQGFALAEIAAQKGADVTIIAGNTVELPTPAGAEIVRVSSTQQMYEAVFSSATATDLFIMAAAVADFRPVSSADSKLKKGVNEDSLTQIELTENPDILKAVVEQYGKEAIVVGFAAETGGHEKTALELAQEKLARKGADLLMANDVSGGAVFGQLRNAGWLLGADGSVVEIQDGDKLAVAAQIVEGIELLPWKN